MRRAVSALAAVSAISMADTAQAALSIRTITWDVIGLDSNDEDDGPETFVVGARVTNTGAAAVNNVTGTFIWNDPLDDGNINLTGPSVLSVPTLAAGASTDFYYNVKVDRNDGSTLPANRTRQYQISAVADGESIVTTTAGRELFVEQLVSQGRNEVTEFTGPTNVLVGQTYQYTLKTETAPAGYEQVESFVNFPNHIFQIVSVQSTYTVGGVHDTVYVDACGWNPITRVCGGTGKAGGEIETVYTVKILAATPAGSPETVTCLIYDFSGSSYHYNSDFGTGINAKEITAVAPASTGTVNGHVYNDVNNNGIKDLGEAGLPDIEVRIVDSSNPAGSIFLTDASGNYSVPVAAGNVTISIETGSLTPGMVVSGVGTSPQLVLVPGGSSPVATPIGLYQAPAIAGSVFLDVNGNGVQDVAEPGIPGVPVMVGMTPTVTDADGNYIVPVAAGPVTLSAPPPANHYLTTANNPQTVSAAAGSVSGATPIGFQIRFAVQGRVWNDDDFDQTIDGGESGAPGIGVQIVDAFGVTRSGVTNGTGNYSILAPLGNAIINFLSGTFGGKVVTTGNNPQPITVTDPAIVPSGNAAAPVGLGISSIPVGPIVSSGTYLSPASLTITFDQPMGAGVLTPAYYTISGPGVGTLAPSPSNVTHMGGNVYLLTWNTGAMAPGQLLTVTVDPVNVFNAGGTAMQLPNQAIINVPGGGTGPSCTCVVP